MNIKKNKCEFIIYDNINKFIFKFPYNNIYKCYDCSFNIPIVSNIKKCNKCLISFIKLSININKNKCYYCDNYLCDNCIKTKTFVNIYNKFSCSNIH